MAGRHRKPPASRGSGRHRRSPAHAQWIAPALVSLVVIGAGGIGAYAALSARSDGAPARPGPTTTVSTPTAGATATPPPPSAPPGTQRPSHGPRATPRPALALTVTGRVSWVEVTRSGGHVVFSGLLRHGKRLVYRSGGLTVVIGDAGAVRLARHGRVAAPAGRPGQVLRIVVR